MGHEFTGTVVEKGDDVKNLAVGDVVVSPFTVSWCVLSEIERDCDLCELPTD